MKAYRFVDFVLVTFAFGFQLMQLEASSNLTSTVTLV